MCGSRRPTSVGGAGSSPGSTHSLMDRRATMARLPARSGGRNMTLINPTREFEDIYDRMGQRVNLAFGDVTPAQLMEVPWVPLADLSETDDSFVVRLELPGVRKDQVDVQLQDRELV